MTTPNQPGWYDDPHDANAQRYWDGQGWTPHRQQKPTAWATQPAPQQWPPPSPQSHTAGADMASEGPATAKDVANLSITDWLLFGGLVVAAVGMFFSWVTVSADIPLRGHLSEDRSPFQDYRTFGVLLLSLGPCGWPGLLFPDPGYRSIASSGLRLWSASWFSVPSSASQCT